MNYVRVHQTSGDTRRIPGTDNNPLFNYSLLSLSCVFLDVGYNMYKKNYAEPKQSEGLNEIIHIEFVPKFDSERDEKIFHNYTES